MKKGLLNTIKKKQLSFVEPTGGKLISRGPVFAIDRPPAHMIFVESAPPHNQLICPCRKKKGFFLKMKIYLYLFVFSMSKKKKKDPPIRFR